LGYRSLSGKHGSQIKTRTPITHHHHKDGSDDHNTTDSASLDFSPLNAHYLSFDGHIANL
jgi:hypothetical protein